MLVPHLILQQANHKHKHRSSNSPRHYQSNAATQRELVILYAFYHLIKMKESCKREMVRGGGRVS